MDEAILAAEYPAGIAVAVLAALPPREVHSP
jgi:hypothetical protein